MENDADFSETKLHRALYDICGKDTNAEVKEQGLNFLAHFSENREMFRALLAFTMKENEDRFVQKYASTCLVRFLERKNPLIRPMMRIFLCNMQVPEKINSMRKGFFLFIKIIVDTVHEPERDYCRFIAQLMMKYLTTENDPQLHELGAIMLHALLKNMTIQMLLHAKYIAEGLQILLKKSKFALQEDAEKSYVLVFHTLMSATILGQHMSRISIVLQPFRNSLGDILNLLKFIAAYGTKSHFNDVSELLKILLKHKQLSGTKWLLILKACECICGNEEYQDFARIRTLKIFGNVVSLRRIYFQRSKILRGMLTTLISILGQKPVYKVQDSFEEQVQQLPTPQSVAADLLEFISSKFPKDEVCDSCMKILLSPAKCRALNEWQFRGIFISLARIVKNCGSYLNSKYAKELMVIFRAGFIDTSLNVHQAAIYALQKFFTYFYEECVCWVRKIFPVFVIRISDYRDGQLYHPMHIERLFGTMKIFCEVLDIELIKKYLPLMTKAFQNILQHISQPRIIILMLELLQDVICYTGVEFSAYFYEVAIKLTPYLTSWKTTEHDEIRTCIVEFLTQQMLNGSEEFMETNGHVIIELIFNLLQTQHVYTQNNGTDLEFLLKYSPLRCSIFRFFGKISHIGAEGIVVYMPKLLGTLVGTITAVKFIGKEELTQFGICNRRYEFVDHTDLSCFKKATYFKISDNDEIEISKFSMRHDSYTLYDEIFVALITVQNIIESCPILLQPYTESLFSKLSQILKYPYTQLRKQLLYTLNIMMDSFLEDFPFADCNFLDQSITEIVSLIEMEIDFTIMGECVRAFLNYIAINEKYLQLNVDTHVFFMNMMTEIFQTIALLPQTGIQRRKKDFLLSKIIAFMSKLITICTPLRFSNYFGIYLYIFEAKLHLPLYRSAISDRNRSQAYEKLIEGFHLMERNSADNFKRLSYLFMKGLNDPVNLARENAAAGLGMLVDHCDPQPVVFYKTIINALWKRSKRENNDVVLDCIWYGMILTVKRNIWQQPIQKLSVKLINLLPIRHIFEYNMIMVEFFEYICLNRPEDISPIIKDIYKYLLEILENVSDTDIDPLYKRALSLASKLYSIHLEELQQISIKPLIMEAILCAYKNKTCLKTVLRLEG